MSRSNPTVAQKVSLPGLPWKIHTRLLIEETMGNPNLWALKQPFQIFYQVLQEVAGRAIELNDPELNLLMARLTLYDQADPTSKGFVPGLVEQLAAAVAATGQDQPSAPAKQARRAKAKAPAAGKSARA